MSQLELFLQVEGDRRIELIKLPEDTNAGAILAEVERLGFAVEGLLVFIEGHDDPIAVEIILRDIGIRHRHRVHAHRCSRIEATLHFNNVTKQHAFTPHTTVAAAKAWFVDAIKMPAVDASEHVLQITGTQDRPDGDLYLGSLVQHHHCAIDFTLVPRKRVEG